MSDGKHTVTTNHPIVKCTSPFLKAVSVPSAERDCSVWIQWVGPSVRVGMKTKSPPTDAAALMSAHCILQGGAVLEISSKYYSLAKGYTLAAPLSTWTCTSYTAGASGSEKVNRGQGWWISVVLLPLIQPPSLLPTWIHPPPLLPTWIHPPPCPEICPIPPHSLTHSAQTLPPMLTYQRQELWRIVLSQLFTTCGGDLVVQNSMLPVATAMQDLALPEH